MTQKDEKIKEIIRELAARFYSEHSNRTSMITVTDVAIESRGGKAVILMTVLPESEEQPAIEFAHRKLTEFREFVKTNSRIARIPFFDVRIDAGEKNRQRIDELGKSI